CCGDCFASCCSAGRLFSGIYIVFFFFFQAEDGIRDATVTGVQTCALPILVIVLSCGGSPLDAAALDALAVTAVRWVRVEREGDAACLAGRVCHDDPPDRFRERVRAWAAARGWAVTVAPGRRLG